MPELVLASTSPYRKELLSRLGLPFRSDKPWVDETPLIGEAPLALARRLARAKAQAVCVAWPDSLTIGSDQVATVDGELFGKPGSREGALAQLARMSGRVVTFHTAVCVMHSDSGEHEVLDVPTEVGFRKLAEADIARYVEREPAYDCAGAAKVEALGISLLEFVRSDDPTALVGLPLIALCRLLRARGIQIP